MMSEPARLYELKIVATGTVRDKDGNVIGEGPIEATALLTEQELHQHIRLMEAAKETTA